MVRPLAYPSCHLRKTPPAARWALSAGVCSLALASCGVAGTTPLGGLQSMTARDLGPEAPHDLGRGRPDLGPSLDVGPRGPDLGPPPALDILARLRRIEGTTVRELAPPERGVRAFSISLAQPENHDDPNSPRFPQRLILRHVSTNAPMVMNWTGYGLFGIPDSFARLQTEPAGLLQANQLTIEHRFFGESILGRDANWTHLNVRQAASDAHRIVTLLRPIYDRPWLGTGVSKGGMTVIFHRAFFPDDLEVIVPYVAPISVGFPDARYLSWVARLGPRDGRCRARVLDLAVEGIERREELGAYHRDNAFGARAIPQAFLPVWAASRSFRYHWEFWQRRGRRADCEGLPSRGAPIAAIADYLEFSNEAERAAYDPEIDPYYYQAFTELGYPAVDYDHVTTAFAQVQVGSALPPREPPPWDDRTPLTGDGRTMNFVQLYLSRSAEKILAVYGGWDPWTAGRIRNLPEDANRLVVIPEAGHDAKLADLGDAELRAIAETLNAWIGRSNVVVPDGTTLRSRVDALRADHQRWVELARRGESALFRALR